MIAALIILPLHRLKLAKPAISKAEKRFLSPSFIYLLFQFLLLINQGLPLFLQEEFPTDALCYWIKVLLTMLIPYLTATYLLSPMQEIPDFGKNWLETRNKSSWYSDVTQVLWPLFVQPWIFSLNLYCMRITPWLFLSQSQSHNASLVSKAPIPVFFSNHIHT